jgi:nucleoside-diphosphate-sugar epimerase
MKYLLTGATGYIGGRMARQLLTAGHQVIFVIRPTFAAGQKLKGILEDFPRAEYMVHRYHGFKDLIDPVREADGVIHLAALYDGGNSLQTASELVKANVLLSTELMTAIGEYNPSISFVSTSTFAAFNGQGEYAPSNLYSATKDAVEGIAWALPHIKTGFLRLGDTFGPADPRPKVHNLIRDSINESKPFQFRSPAQQVINLTHVDDVINALMTLLIMVEFNSETYPVIYDFLPGVNFITLEELAKILNSYIPFEYSFPTSGDLKPTDINLQPHNLPVGFTLHPVKDCIQSIFLGDE